MSSYIQAISTKSYFKEEHKEDLLKLAKSAAAAYAPGLSIGWRADVLNAETLADVAREFNITLYHTDSLGDGVQVLPIVNETYRTDFFKQLLPLIAPYMSDGSIELLDSDYGLYVVEFKGGAVTVSHD